MGLRVFFPVTQLNILLLVSMLPASNFPSQRPTYSSNPTSWALELFLCQKHTCSLIRAHATCSCEPLASRTSRSLLGSVQISLLASFTVLWAVSLVSQRVCFTRLVHPSCARDDFLECSNHLQTNQNMLRLTRINVQLSGAVRPILQI